MRQLSTAAATAATIMTTTNANKTTIPTAIATSSSTLFDDAEDAVGSTSQPADVAATSAQAQPFENDSAYSKAGLAMWLNNRPDRAEQHFRARLDSTQIFAGYAFIISMVRDGKWGVVCCRSYICGLRVNDGIVLIGIDICAHICVWSQKSVHNRWYRDRCYR